jgi:DNA polymerase elongation subunit (family B)
MKTSEYDKIIFPDQRNAKPRVKPKTPKPIMSVDTETEDGKAFLMCAYGDNGVMDYIEVESVEDWMEYLFQHHLRGYIITFWNVRYDWTALIAHFPTCVLEQLAIHKEADFKGYHFRNFGDKFYRISKGHKSVDFYDMSQFYDRKGLDYISSKFLGEHKEDVDRKHISKDRFLNDIEYHDKLVSYCLNDAKMTYELSKLFFSEIDTTIPSVDWSRPISSANFSGQLMLQTLPQLQEQPDEVKRMLFQAYKGGRFETIQKGYFEDVFEYDLSSAYPSAMREYLFSFEDKWFPTKEYHRSALYGVYEVIVSVDECDKNTVCPLPVKAHNGLLIYPSGKIHTFIIKPEFELLERYGYNVEILKGYEFAPPNEEPKALLKPLIDHLYEQKQRYKKEGNDVRYQTYKVVLNSLYGKTLQLVSNAETEETSDLHDADEFVFFPDNSAKAYKNKATVYKAGILFNLNLACYITAMARIKLFEFSKRYEQDVISYATDGVYMLKDVPVSGAGIGCFEKEHYNIGIIYGNGLYKLDNKERARGLMKNIFSNPKVKLEYGLDKIKATYDKPLQLGEAYRTKRLTDLNKFLPYKKTINFNNDGKRIFPEHIRYEDITKRPFYSYPLTIDEHYEDATDLNRVIKYGQTVKRTTERALKASDYWDSSLEDEENLRILNPSLKDVLYRDLER